jgi:NTE family protein
MEVRVSCVTRKVLLANQMQWLSPVSIEVSSAAHPTPVTINRRSNDLAVMLTGGGARAAYQVGLLRGIARHFPNLRFQVITGVSAGAINAVFLAAAEGSLYERVELLREMWWQLETRHIFRFEWRRFIPFRSALATLFPRRRWRRPYGWFDTTPLRELLQRVLHTRAGQPIGGIERNIARGALKSVALVTLDYSTGQSVRWVQGRHFDVFEGPNRRAAAAKLTVEHVLASAALPFVFPAVRLGKEWHGDGGIRLAAPLSPAVHLGATRILAMSTGYQRTEAEAATPTVSGYPPAAQIMSQIINSVFLDVIDEDVVRMQRMNEMIRKLPPSDRDGLRPIDLHVLRPSVDLGKIAGDYEKYLPLNLKMVTRAMGANETDSPDFVSLLMFEPNYLQRLIELGEHDVESRLDELRTFFGEDAQESQVANVM